MAREIIDSVEKLEAELDRVRAAQREFATYTQEQVDKIFFAAAMAANKARIPLAKMAVEETGMGYGLEVDMIRKAHELDMVTCPYVFDAEQARAMAEAGADCLVAHMGLTTKGSIGAETAKTLDDCIPLIREIIAAGREVNPDIMVICHGGPIADPEDAAYIIRNVPEIDGFFGASSIERLASERGMTAQAAAFKAISK